MAASSSSTLGDRLVFVALALYVTDIGSPTDVGLVLAANASRSSRLLLFGGVWADRLPRHRVMVVTDLVRALLHGLLARADLLSAPVADLGDRVIEAGFGTAHAFFRPAYTGLVPQTVPEDVLQQAKAVNGVLQRGRARRAGAGRRARGGPAPAGAFVIDAARSSPPRAARAAPAPRGERAAPADARRAARGLARGALAPLGVAHDRATSVALLPLGRSDARPTSRRALRQRASSAWAARCGAGTSSARSRCAGGRGIRSFAMACGALAAGVALRARPPLASCRCSCCVGSGVRDVRLVWWETALAAALRIPPASGRSRVRSLPRLDRGSLGAARRCGGGRSPAPSAARRSAGPGVDVGLGAGRATPWGRARPLLAAVDQRSAAQPNSPRRPRRASRPARRAAAGCARRGSASRPASTPSADRARHRHRVLGARDRARAQHRVAAELHRQRRVGRGADARVEDHRHAGALADQAHVVRVEHAHARSRSASRAASPPRSRRPPAGARASGRRWCRAAR